MMFNNENYCLKMLIICIALETRLLSGNIQRPTSPKIHIPMYVLFFGIFTRFTIQLNTAWVAGITSVVEFRS